MTKKQQTQKKHPAYKVVISGSYRTAKKEYINFENVEGYIPLVDEEVARAMLLKRYAEMWVPNVKDEEGGKMYPERIQSIREVYVDVLKESEHHFSFYGKDIRELTYEELQDLATAKELRAIPLYKKGGLRHSQTVAYAAYSDRVLGAEVDYKVAGFKLLDQPPIIVDELIERDDSKKFTNEEIIQQEMDRTSTKAPSAADYTRPELEALAHEKNVTFNPAITDQKLYNKIFNAA